MPWKKRMTQRSEKFRAAAQHLEVSFTLFRISYSHRETCPDDHHRWEPYPRGNLLDGQRVRDLADDICCVSVFRLLGDFVALTSNSETRIDDVVVRADQVQILLHPRDIGVCESGSVQIVEKERDARV